MDGEFIGVGETDYGRCWDRIAEDRMLAFRLMDNSTTEEQIAEKGRMLAAVLIRGLAIGSGDTVLDLGCGVARIGRELAPHAGRYIGVDVSEKMLVFARERLQGIPGVETHVVSGTDLGAIPDASVDRMYCHGVFIHLDKEDVYGYLCEARRVLKPGGLFYFDVWNLKDRVGWLRWQVERKLYPTRARRPIHRCQFSTPDEIGMMLAMADLPVLLLAPSLVIQVVCTSLPAGADRPAALASLHQTYGGCFEALRFDAALLEVFEGVIRAELKDAGATPEEPPPAAGLLP